MSTAFYETYRRFCQNLGKSDNAVAAEIGLSNSTVTTWRQGAIPRRPTIKKVADYFGVTVEEMMGYSAAEKAPAPKGERSTDPDIRKIERAKFRMPEKEWKHQMEVIAASMGVYFSDDYEDDDLDE